MIRLPYGYAIDINDGGGYQFGLLKTMINKKTARVRLAFLQPFCIGNNVQIITVSLQASSFSKFFLTNSLLCVILFPQQSRVYVLSPPA